jgi:hypothetical protein
MSTRDCHGQGRLVMTGFEKDKLKLPTEEVDSDVTENTVLEDENSDEFFDEVERDDDLEVEFNPEKNPAMDSVEINVEDLLSEIRADANSADASNVRVRKELEAMLERKRRHEDTMDLDEYDLED